MYLVDTSIWIDYFKEIKNAKSSIFISILEQNIPYGITGIIYQEVLQGAASDKDLNKLIDYLSTQRFFQPQDEISTYEAAAKLYYRCRKKGITLRSTIDCLIAQIAIEHGLVLIHNDRDYNRIGSVCPELLLI